MRNGVSLNVYEVIMGEFENSAFEDYCDEVGIKQEFSTPTTPQQNGVIERKNRVIQDMACAMLHGKGLATHL